MVTDGYVSNDPDANADAIAAFPTLSAPFVFASVDNGYPKLAWGAVQHADNYKVYRRIEQGSWQFIGTVYTTSFTDNTQYSANMTTLSSPHPNWDDTIGYKVKAAASGLDDSPYSHARYFSTSGSGGQIESTDN